MAKGPWLIVTSVRYSALALMDRHLASSAFLVGTALSLADVALLAYTRLAPEGGFALGDYPALRRWIGDAERAFAEFSMEAMWRQMELALRDETQRFGRNSTIELTRNLDDAASDVRDRMKQWYAGRWFAPNAFKSRSLIDQIHGIYVPYWTFDAQVHCPWEAEAGYHYYTTETYRDSNGNTQTRQVQHTRWEYASGEVDHFFDDEPVPATTGIDHGLLRGVEPFPTHELVPYDTAFLSGHVVEHYKVVLVEAAQRSQEQMQQKLTQLCAAQIPGDTYRNLRIAPSYAGRTFKHVLVPVWLLSYTYGRSAFQVIVNGYTGAIAGRYPKSLWKILGLVALGAIVVAVLLWLNAQQGGGNY